MRMLLVEAGDAQGKNWVSCVREDLNADGVFALFYTHDEARAFIIALRGLMHMGGAGVEFRIVPVLHDGVDWKYEVQE